MFSTTLSSWAFLVWKALQELGYDPKPVFERAGLNPDLLADPNARYPLIGMQKLWEEAGRISDDPCFGLEAGRRVHPTTFHALGFAWLASSSLHDALNRLTRYVHVVSGSVRARVEPRGATFVFTFGSPEDLIANQAVDAGLVALMQMCRQLRGESYEPHGVLMSHARLSCCGRLEAFFRAPVEYSAKENGLIFDAHSIDQRVLTANAELARINEEVVIKYLSQLDRSSVATLVKARLVELLPSGRVGEEQVAGALNISLRSLQRRLLEERTNYTKLLDEIRRNMAKDYLENSTLSINEIAYLLGFSEQANFSRAFRRWYGTSPSAYRGLLTKALDASV